MGTAASSTQAGQIVAYRQGRAIRRGRAATANQTLRANALLQTGIVRHARAPTHYQPLRRTSRAARGAIEGEHRAAVRYAALLARRQTGARVTDAHGYPMNGMRRADIEAVHRWAVSTPGVGAAAMARELALEWPAVVGSTYLWAASTPLQGAVAVRLEQRAAALDPAGAIEPHEFDDHPIRNYIHLPANGPGVARFVCALRTYSELHPAAADADDDRVGGLLVQVGALGAIPYARAILQVYRARGVLQRAYRAFIWRFGFCIRAHAVHPDPRLARFEAVARFMMADDPEMVGSAEFQGALDTWNGNPNEIISPPVRAWLETELAGSAEAER